MGNFSRDPSRELQRSREQGYLGVHIEQGVPLLDRDLNLLADLVASSVRDVLAHHLGNGIAQRDEAFAIEATRADNDFTVAAPAGGGACLVAGIQVRIDTPLRYSAQPGVPTLTTPAGGDRVDLVYLDVWVEEVDAAEDVALRNDADLGMQTSVRLRCAWAVRVAEGIRRAPEPRAGHAHCPLAMLERAAGEAAIRERMIVDLRQTGLHLGDLARRIQRIEDVLFSPSIEALALDMAPERVEYSAWQNVPLAEPEPVSTRKGHTT